MLSTKINNSLSVFCEVVVDVVEVVGGSVSAVVVTGDVATDVVVVGVVVVVSLPP